VTINPISIFHSDIFKDEQEKANLFRQIGSVTKTRSEDLRVKSILPTGDANYVGDDGVISSKDTVMEDWLVDSRKIAKIVKVGTELIEDSGFDLTAALAADFGRSFGTVEEAGCVGGDGIYQPYGILHETKGAETGATVSTDSLLTLDDVRSLYFSVDPQYRRNASWLMNDETALYLRSLKDNDGHYLWRDSDDSILSKTVYTSPYMPGMTAGGKPIAFGDFSYYWFIQRGEVNFKVLDERYFVQGARGFLGFEYIDGRLARREAVKVLQMA
jgi:HK97 family phage major capsid protein